MKYPRIYTIRHRKKKDSHPHIVKLNKPRSGYSRQWKLAERKLGMMLWYGPRDPETLMPIFD